jgi:flagellar biosynthesis chaperone FliJ
MSVNAYRSQILLERLRLQQEQVSKATRELSFVRAEVGEIKGNLAAAKERQDDAEKQFDKGVMSTASLNAVRSSLLELKRREEFLNEREAQLSIEVDTERANLSDLNKRLDALEREIVTSSGNDSKKNSKN